MNSICITLRLECQPESRYTNNQKLIGSAICSLEFTKNDEELSKKIKVTVWQNVEEFILLQKGDLVLFDGSTRFDSVEKEGYKEKVVSFNCNAFQLIEGSNSPSTPNPSRVISAANTHQTPVSPIAPPAIQSNPDYDDIPF
ncbi:single-stranded DNA-binding protein [Pseudanabaena sp. 'Roaring Creek']|uniref:single-stranded DNA-binding protein n=1 Tax=Pseudanabaena sp. 'Roaring Creek' TaxID=1681830 RepID=UPI0006D7F1E6|nr:single-stranded DNA-binding protein [Pseudanabaena sp. 'Roaring Creek']